MIPLHVGIMTPTSAVMMPSVQVISKPPIHKKEILRIKDNNENSGPTTTVFVGNISEKASDMLIRQLLAVRNIKGFSYLKCTRVTLSSELVHFNIVQFDGNIGFGFPPEALF